MIPNVAMSPFNLTSDLIYELLRPQTSVFSRVLTRQESPLTSVFSFDRCILHRSFSRSQSIVESVNYNL